jgi:hypothetical protein
MAGTVIGDSEMAESKIERNKNSIFKVIFNRYSQVHDKKSNNYKIDVY